MGSDQKHLVTNRLRKQNGMTGFFKRRLIDFEMDRIPAAAIFLLAVGLSFWQLLENRSLWFDEAILALNIIEKSRGELFKPLEYGQVAPILYLQLIKAFAGLTALPEVGMRLVSLLCFWGFLWFYHQAGLLWFRDRLWAALALAFVGLNPTLLYFSGELKQYMGDVMLGAAILWALLLEIRGRNYGLVYMGILGVVGIFLSNVAPILLLAAGLSLGIRQLSSWKKGEGFQWKSIIRLAILGSTWVVAFGLYYWLFIKDHPTREWMVSFWQNQNAFMPLHFFGRDFYLFVKERLGSLVYTTLVWHHVYAVLFVMLYLLGKVTLIRNRSFALAIFLLAPIITHLLLSSLEIYPFFHRLKIYLIPMLVFSLTVGTWAVFEGLKLKRGLVWALIILVMAMPLKRLLNDFPRQHHEIKEVFMKMEQEKLPDHGLVIAYGAMPPFNYYEKTGLFTTDGFSEVVHTNWYGSSDAFFQEYIAPLQGDYWLLFALSFHNEESIIIDRLVRQGRFPQHRIQAYGASAYLFTLSPDYAD